MPFVETGDFHEMCIVSESTAWPSTDCGASSGTVTRVV